MRYLGIDYGTVRMGTAISDQTGTIARPYQLLDSNNVIDQIKDIILHEQIDAIVLGLPKNMNNTIGESGNNALALKQSLESLSIPVFLQDERRTTHEAESLLISGNVRRKDRKQKIDNMAATIILQTFLDTCQKH